MTKDEKEKLGADVAALYSDAGFSAPSKREVDLLVFHHLTQSREHKGKSNYELASFLKIPESRVKTLRLNSALRHQTINSKAVLGNIILRLSRGQQFTNLGGEKIEISLEDPIEKRELENFLKSKGHFADYTFNAEVLRIDPARLFELIVENMEKPEECFDKLIQDCIADDAVSGRLLDGAPTIKQKFARFRKETMAPKTLGALLSTAAGMYHPG